jgi:hypothetical protein
VRDRPLQARDVVATELCRARFVQEPRHAETVMAECESAADAIVRTIITSAGLLPRWRQA